MDKPSDRDQSQFTNDYFPTSPRPVYIAIATLLIGISSLCLFAYACTPEPDATVPTQSNPQPQKPNPLDGTFK